MKRTNTYKIEFAKPEQVHGIAMGCAVLWNKIAYKRRQSYFNTSKVDFDTHEFHDEFLAWLGSNIYQQVIRKNDMAWRAYFKLKQLLAEGGRLPPTIKHVSPPGYWKDRDTGEYTLIIPIRNDCYEITNGGELRLPKKVCDKNGAHVKGQPKWTGKQGTVEIHYSGPKQCWYAYQPVVVEEELTHQTRGHKMAFVDIGIRCIIAGGVEGDKQGVAYNGGPLISDWLYLSERIAKCQAMLKKVNNAKTSKLLDSLYRKRSLRYRQAVNTYVKRFVGRCHDAGVTEILAGDLTGVLEYNSTTTANNKLLHNMWSHAYVMNRLHATAENYSIAVTFKSEAYTSSSCPACHSTNIRKHKRLIRCNDCGKEYHRDVAGFINIGTVYGYRECVNGVLAHPLLMGV